MSLTLLATIAGGLLAAFGVLVVAPGARAIIVVVELVLLVTLFVVALTIVAGTSVVSRPGAPGVRFGLRVA